MSLPPLHGHEAVREVLVRAAATGDIPQSLLLHGPPGIGKERLGLWIAQLLLCERPDPVGGPCDACRSCRMTLTLEHPDVHWFFPLPRPDGATQERLREKLEDARAVELQARRAHPLRPPQWDRPPAHYLAAVRNLQERAANRPAMGSRSVFVVGEAEAMVPQESSPEAANAFLKLLEEPPPHATLILTSARPGALLPTIRSRVLPIRLLPLERDEVEQFLVRFRDLPADQARAVAARSEGAIGTALRLLPGEDGARAPMEEQRHAGHDLLAAALSGSPAPRIAAALAEAPSGKKDDFIGRLDSLGGWLRDLAAVAAGVPEHAANEDHLPFLSRSVQTGSVHPLGAAAALDRVDRARELAEGNVNPQLVLADLLRGIASDLRSRG